MTPAAALEIRSNLNSLRWGSVGIPYGELTFGGNKAIVRGKPGQDLSLGGNNSFDQLFIKGTTGNVGIGTTNPVAPLVISEGVSNLETRIDDGGISWTRKSDGAVVERLAFNGFSLMTLSSRYNFKLSVNSDTGILFMDDATGNVGIGTMSPTARLQVAGDVVVDGNIAAKYQDVAEWVPTSSFIEPGTVVVIDPQEINHVQMVSQAYDTRIAGVVSSRPGILLGEAGEDKVKVAHSGRVKVKVDAQYGPIKAGDLLVSSATPGYAMLSTPLDVNGISMHRPGTILGKALEPLKEGQAEILVLVTLQ